MNEPPDLIRRQQATEKTKARYGGQPFSWRKSTTCLHMARFQMQAMGHKPPKMPSIRSPLRAKKELQARGCATLVELFDGFETLERIAPAQMRLGDLAAFPGDPDQNATGFEGLIINVAPRKFLGWHPDQFEMAVIDLELADVIAAWRL